jgi:GTPase SAR1 family protein
MGRISTGKSALIRALLPGAEVESDPRGGTTRIATHYTWSSPANDQLILTDVPGLDEVGGELDDMAREEGTRAHVVVFVTDSDITREQDRELKGLLPLGKPTIVALNKMDLYTDQDLEAIKNRLTERVASAKDVQVVAVSAGGTQDAIRQLPDGSEQEIVREVPPKVEALQFALQRYIDRDIEALNSLRDGAVFVLAQRKLDDAEAVHRHEKAEKLVSSYTKKAVVGAMAAVTPGSDLIIQGYLGLSLVKDLCEVYQVPARKMDIQQFLTFVSRHVGKTLTLLLAVAGNGLKAFPGLGTVAGGLVHAVAYGLIFDSLGRAVIETLETRGELTAAPAAIMFEEKLGEDLESRARYFAKLALAGRRDKDKGQADDPA